MTKRSITWLLFAPPLWFIALIASSDWTFRSYRLSETVGIGLESGSLVIFHCASHQNFYAREGYQVTNRSCRGPLYFGGRKSWETFFAHGETVQPWGDYTIIEVWPLAIVAAIPLAAVALRRTTCAARELLRARAGVCTQCGYDLRATPARCPECGTRADSSIAFRTQSSL